MSRTVIVILRYHRYKPRIALTSWAGSGDNVFPVRYRQTYRVEFEIKDRTTDIVQNRVISINMPSSQNYR
jgi:hypothetical protein